MRRIAMRLLLVGVALAGLAGLGFGVASLTTAAASASPVVTSAHVLASSTSSSTATASPGMRSCPNMSSSGSSSSS
ncbi:MAG: hypothetical protein WBF51_06940 [Candidatus Dormiibacterota bacterium]